MRSKVEPNFKEKVDDGKFRRLEEETDSEQQRVPNDKRINGRGVCVFEGADKKD
jgi:hypothetical protein